MTVDPRYLAVFERIAVALEDRPLSSQVREFLPLAIPSHEFGTAGQGHNSLRPKTAADKVRAHLAEHPADAKLPVRVLAEIVGVGKSTVDRVLKE